MENQWIWVPLLVIMVFAFFYFGFRDDYKRGPKELIRKIIEASIETVAAFFFGIFGFSWELFIGKNEN